MKPLPYRLRSSSIRFQVPNLSSIIPDTRRFKAMRKSTTWQTITTTVFTIRTWVRRTIWGDRLFLQFRGPSTILLQTRASRVRDVLTSSDVDEAAYLEPGAIQPLARRMSATSPVESSDARDAIAPITSVRSIPILPT